MFKVVEGAVPAGNRGRIDLFVKRDETSGATVATWDRAGVAASAKGPVRARRIETFGMPVEDAYREAVKAAKEANVPLCIFDVDRIFPKTNRPKVEGVQEV